MLRRVIAIGGVEFGNELVTVPVHSADYVLTVRAVADRAPRFHDRTGERRFADHDAGPHSVLNLVLVDGTVSLLDQIGEQIEDPWLERNGFAVLAELTRRKVQLVAKEFQQLLGLLSHSDP